MPRSALISIFGGGGGVFWNWKVTKCQDLPKFQFSGRGYSKTEKSQSAKICLNFNFREGGVFRSKLMVWKIWTKIYCSARNLLVHHSSLSHTTYVETNEQCVRIYIVLPNSFAPFLQWIFSISVTSQDAENTTWEMFFRMILHVFKSEETSNIISKSCMFPIWRVTLCLLSYMGRGNCRLFRVRLFLGLGFLRCWSFQQALSLFWDFTLLIFPTSLESIPEEEFRRPGRRSISEVWQ